MQINKDSFVKWLKLLNTQGEILNNELFLNISKKKITALSASANKNLILYGEYSGDFEDIGDVGVGNITTLIDFLNNFKNKKIDISKKDNKLVLKSDEEKLKISYILKNPDYLFINKQENKLDYKRFTSIYEKTIGNEMVFDIDIQSKIITYFNSIKAASFLLTGEEKTLKMRVGANEHEIEAEMPLQTQIKPISIRVGKSLIEILKMTNTDKVISTYNEQPISIKIESPEYKITYIVSQLKK